MGVILEELWRNFWKIFKEIPGGTSRISGRIPEEFLEEPWRNSEGIPEQVSPEGIHGKKN